MTLKEANYEVERLNNDLNRLLKEKEVLEATVLPQAIDTAKIVVDGGKRVDRLQNYLCTKELKDLDNQIQLTQDKIKNYMDWIDRELKILKKYDKVEQLIVYYKEIDTKVWTWHQISVNINYSIPQCRRIYKRYKQKRFFEDDHL